MSNPTVVIVGRTNVGKSTLFNRLSVSAKSITLDLAGVTRDFIKDTVCWHDRCFDLIDTGGISLRKSADPIMEQVRQQALQFIEKADLILFVCDGKTGPVIEDVELAKKLRPFTKKVALVINKLDAKATREHLPEFERFGFSTMVPLSALHGTGTADLLEFIVSNLPARLQAVQEEERICRVVLLGKPNVGKSSLLNQLLKQERAIVSEQPGTTREAISEKIKFNKADIELTDTAGIRRKRSVTETLETLMVKSSFRAVDDADIVLLLIDASEAKLSDQELKLAFYVFEQHKALVLLFNKQDLVTDLDRQDMERSVGEYQHLMKKVEKLSISCKTGKNVGSILPLVDTVWKRYSQKFDEGDLSRLFKEALQRKPLYHKTHLLHVYKVKQIDTAPITLLVFVNEPLWFKESQMNFFEAVMRATYDLKSVPIKFIVRKRG